MADQPDLEQALEKMLSGAMRRLEAISNPQFVASVCVQWNGRMRSAAGRAFLKEAKVELNPKLLQISLEEVERTLLHELAHLLVYHRYGNRGTAPHGVEWQRACAELGIPGESATHRLPLPKRKQKKKWRYTCPQCGEGIERVRPMKKAAACYTCCQQWNQGYFTKKYLLVAERL